MTKIVGLGCDHAGYELKTYIKEKLISTGYIVKDYGSQSSQKVDYPDIIHPLANDVDKNNLTSAIIVCGSGNGVAITANKYVNVRAALCWESQIAKYARLHNDANIVALPARFICKRRAWNIVKKFLTTEFEGGRHLIRVNKIKNIIS